MPHKLRSLATMGTAPAALVRTFIEYWYETNGGISDAGPLEVALLKYLAQRIVMFFQDDASGLPLDQFRVLAVLFEVLQHQDEKAEESKKGRSWGTQCKALLRALHRSEVSKAVIKAIETHRDAILRSLPKIASLMGLVDPFDTQAITEMRRILNESMMLGLRSATGELVWRFSFIQVVNGFSSLAQLTSFAESYKKSIRALGPGFADFEQLIEEKIVSVRSNRVQYRYGLDYLGLHLILTWLLYTNRAKSERWPTVLATVFSKAATPRSAATPVPISVFFDYQESPNNPMEYALQQRSQVIMEVARLLQSLPQPQGAFRATELFDSLAKYPAFVERMEADAIGRKVLDTLKQRRDSPFQEETSDASSPLTQSPSISSVLKDFTPASPQAKRGRPTSSKPKKRASGAPRSLVRNVKGSQERKAGKPVVADDDSDDSDDSESGHPLSNSRWARNEWEAPLPVHSTFDKVHGSVFATNDHDGSDDDGPEALRTMVRTSRRLAGGRKPIRPGLLVFNGRLQTSDDRAVGEKRGDTGELAPRKRLRTIGNMIAHELVHSGPFLGVTDLRPRRATVMDDDEEDDDEESDPEAYAPSAAGIAKPLFRDAMHVSVLQTNFRELPCDDVLLIHQPEATGEGGTEALKAD